MTTTEELLLDVIINTLQYHNYIEDGESLIQEVKFSLKDNMTSSLKRSNLDYIIEKLQDGRYTN